MTVSEFENWTYSVEEVSAGVYQLKGVDDLGRLVDLTGTDPAKLLRQFVHTAKQMENSN